MAMKTNFPTINSWTTNPVYTQNVGGVCVVIAISSYMRSSPVGGQPHFAILHNRKLFNLFDLKFHDNWFE